MRFRLIAVCALLAAAVTGGILYWRSHRLTHHRTVVVVSVDTLRPDRLGLYGNAPGVSPVIDALGPQAAVFDQALANSPYTLPSHMTMLTGLDPIAHGVKRDGCVLSTRVVTLPETLRDAGFTCGAFTDGGYVSAKYGFSQGFSVFDDHRDEHKGAVNGMSRIVPLAVDWLDRNADEDVFLFVHTFDVHAPYQEGDAEVIERFRQRPVKDGPLDHELHRLSFMHQQAGQRIPEYGRMEELLNDYDAGVFEADRGIGRIIDKLKELGRFEDAVFIVTSDHGESFADHGIQVGHGISLTDDEIHIPLVMRMPRAEAAGRRLIAPVSLLDLAPTVLDAFGLAPTAEMQGESLLGLLRGKPRRSDHIFGYSPNTESTYLVREGWKCISPPSIPPIEVARRHLGPTTPPNGGLAPDHGEDYVFGKQDPNPVTLHYDEVADPLGIRSVILTGFHLYDRANDPHERRNAWEANRTGRGKLMAEYLKQIMETSIQLNTKLDDGTAPPPVGQVHVEQTLKQLGYINAPNQAEAQAYLDSLPPELRKALQEPFHPPEHGTLEEADKVLQFVRMALRDGRTLPPGYGRLAEELARKLVAWRIANPAYKAEVDWRLYELSQLADQLGVAVDAKTWLGKFREQIAQADAASGSVAPPDDTRPPPEHDPDDGPHR